jgi:hypothetical protein
VLAEIGVAEHVVINPYLQVSAITIKAPLQLQPLGRWL